MVSKCVISGAFLFLVYSIFLFFGGVFNKTIIPFALVGNEVGYSQSVKKLLIISLILSSSFFPQNGK